MRRLLLLLLWLTTLEGGVRAGEVEPLPTAHGGVQLEAQGLDGKTVSLREGRGRVTVLVFWSPESMASRKSMGELQRFADMADAREVFFLAISTTGTAESIAAFARARGLTLPLALRQADDLGTLPEQGLPLALLFDQEGRLRQRRVGLIRLRALLEPVRELLK